MSWNLKEWLWVVVCSISIFLTVPLARGLQKFIYASFGKEYFTYAVLLVVIVLAACCLWFMIGRLRVRSIYQYVWMFVISGLYLYATIQLRKHPEEAVHLLEYALLAFLVFRALSCRIKDWTVYPSAALTVLFIGTFDEYIQWLTPSRVWDYRDVGINALAGSLFLFAIFAVLRPDTISQQLRKYSVKLLAVLVTLNALFLGLCLSSTPANVKIITSSVEGLSWIQGEELMTEYGYAHFDKEIGTFYSRLTGEDLMETDYKYGEAYGRVIKQYHQAHGHLDGMKEEYGPHNNPFLHEFLIHVLRRDKDYSKAENQSEMNKKSNSAYREHLIVTRFFKNTLEQSGLVWPDSKIEKLRERASLWNEGYTSRVGKMIVWFDMKTAWVFIVTLLLGVWGSALLWMKRVNES